VQCLGLGLRGKDVGFRVQGKPFHAEWAMASSSSVLLSSLELSDTQVYEPEIRALLGTASHFCEVIFLKLKTVPIGAARSLRTLRVIRRGAQAMYQAH